MSIRVLIGSLRFLFRKFRFFEFQLLIFEEIRHMPHSFCQFSRAFLMKAIFDIWIGSMFQKYFRTFYKVESDGNVQWSYFSPSGIVNIRQSTMC